MLYIYIKGTERTRYNAYVLCPSSFRPETLPNLLIFALELVLKLRLSLWSSFSSWNNYGDFCILSLSGDSLSAGFVYSRFASSISTQLDPLGQCHSMWTSSITERSALLGCSLEMQIPGPEFLGGAWEPAFSTSFSRSFTHNKVRGALFWSLLFMAFWPPSVKRLWFLDAFPSSFRQKFLV